MISWTAKTKLVVIVWLFCFLLASSTLIHNEAEIETHVIEQSIGPLGTDSFEYHRKLKNLHIRKYHFKKAYKYGSKGKGKGKNKKTNSSSWGWGKGRRMKMKMKMWMRGGNKGRGGRGMYRHIGMRMPRRMTMHMHGYYEPYEHYHSGSRGSHGKGKGRMGMYRKRGVKHCHYHYHHYYSHMGKGNGKGGGSRSYGVSTYKCTGQNPDLRMKMRKRMMMRRRMRKRMVMKMNTARQTPSPLTGPDAFPPTVFDAPVTSPPLDSTTVSPTFPTTSATSAPTEPGLVVINPLLTRMTWTWFENTYREPTGAELDDLIAATDAWFLEQLQQDFPPGGDSVIIDLVSDVLSFAIIEGSNVAFNFSFNATFDPTQGSIPTENDVFSAMSNTDLTSYIVEVLFPLTTNGQTSTFQNVQSVFWETLRRRLSQQVLPLPFLRHQTKKELHPRKLRSSG